MEKRQAVFYQETGEDAVVILSDSYTVENAKEEYPEWRFRFCELQPQYRTYIDSYDNEGWLNDPDYYEGQGEY